MSSFFDSRWIEPPERVEVRAHPGLPAGFRAAGTACGIKGDGAPDLGVVVCDEPGVVSAARFTRSATAAAPVLLTMERCRLEGLRGVVVNSGNANAATGLRGLEDAARMQETAARALGALAPETVAVASTGVIGVPLPIDAVVSGIETAAAEVAGDGAESFAEAIRTTDAFPKAASLTVRLGAGDVQVSAQAKGAGMISPGFATLLVFVQSDAALSPATADLLLGVCVKRSFERATVDGQLSTSDMVILQCSGASGVVIEAETADELHFGEALDALLRQLALLVLRDGEGAARVGRVVVRGGDEQAVNAVAQEVADSPLVKTALHGGDPNWGRIVQAAGAALPGAAPLSVDVAIEGIPVCARGAVVPHDHRALQDAVQRQEVEYEVTLPGEGAETERFFSDLGYGYVRINAEYTT